MGKTNFKIVYRDRFRNAGGIYGEYTMEITGDKELDYHIVDGGSHVRISDRYGNMVRIIPMHMLYSITSEEK